MSDTGAVDEFVILAAEAAAAAVAAMATDAWRGVRDTVAKLFHTSRRRKQRRRTRMPSDGTTPYESDQYSSGQNESDLYEPGQTESARNESARLAAVGGEALVRAMPTPAWPTARDQALAWFGRVAPDRIELYRSWLDGNAEELRDAQPADLADVQRELVALWRRQLAELLGWHPAEAGELRRFIDRVSAVPSDARTGTGTKTMTNIARDRSTLYAVMDGNIHQHYDERSRRPDRENGTGEGHSG